MNEKFLFEMLQNLPYYSKLGVKVWGDMKIDFDTGGTWRLVESLMIKINYILNRANFEASFSLELFINHKVCKWEECGSTYVPNI